MVVSGWAELGVTRPPTGISESPMRPPMGARMVPYCRFSSAVLQGGLLRFDLLACMAGDLGARGEAGLIDVGFQGFDVRLVGFQRGGGGVQVLLGSGIGLDQRRETFDVLLRLHQVGLRGGQVGLRLQQRDLFAGEIQVGFALVEVPLACWTAAS